MVLKMTKRLKNKVKDTLDQFLFSQIESSPEYQEWVQDYKLPTYITYNLSKTLRDYQEVAIKHFIWLFEQDPDKAKHLLFNLATGTGKTLTMAAAVLYLYQKGYRNFVFLVHQTQIKDQAIKNFTDYKFEKYLFNPKGVKLNGRSIRINAIDRFQDAQKDAINFMFFSTALLYNRLTEDKENSLTSQDFADNSVVVIADEAHRLNVDTRKKLKKTDEEDIRNWETAVKSAIYSRPDNLLLEFTATVDLENHLIHEKYRDKIIHQYDFLQFNKDGYSKDVGFLFNEETQIEDQKRLLVINAVVFSEYRRLIAEREMNVQINPVILVKSKQIAKSEEDREFFHKVISSLRVYDLDHLRQLNSGKEQLSLLEKDQIRFINQMFSWIASKKSGLVSSQDPSGLNGFIAEIKMRFRDDNSMTYNSQKKEKSELLPLLDSPRNTIRAIFSVNALNEGWDVLSLYDIIHFDVSEAKKVSLQDIQLIGRGARLCPYKLPRAYNISQSGGLFDEEHSYEFDPFKRKFDKSPHDHGRILETFFYHFVKTGTFLDQLQHALLGEGIINPPMEKRTISLKPDFLESETYKKGFVLVNQQLYRSKTTDTEIEATFNKSIKANIYKLYTRNLTDLEQNKNLAKIKYKTIYITEEYFSPLIIRKALMTAENNFFRFNNLKNHIVGLKSIDELIENYLPLYKIEYGYSENKDIDKLEAQEKLQLLVGVILPEVRKAIDRHMPKITGSHIFRPRSLSSIFQQEKNIYLVSYPNSDADTGETTSFAPDERAKPQSDHDNPDLQFDVESAEWYAYSENYGTSEEKKFVKFVATQIEELKSRYTGAEIYVIRNELDYWLFSPLDGRRFSPDYMLIINDAQNGEMYYQCLIEPKGGHIIEKDSWKEKVLISLADESEITFDAEHDDDQNYIDFLNEVKEHGYKEVKCLGFKFYNTEPRTESEFAIDFQTRMPS